MAIAREGINASAEPTTLSDCRVGLGMLENPALPSVQEEPDGLPSALRRDGSQALARFRRSIATDSTFREPPIFSRGESSECSAHHARL